MIIVADYETTTNKEEVTVWLAGFLDISYYDDLNKIEVQTNIRDFFIELIKYIQKNIKGNDREVTCFFHNLKFDGSYIANFLLRNEFDFEYYINDMGVWYSITLNMEGYKLIFRDSMKILNFSIRQIARQFKMPISKGDTPLLENVPDRIKPEWIDYIKVDIGILARGMYSMYIDQHFTKFTSASEALKNFKMTVNYRKLFPLLDEETDKFCRDAYNGGWVYVKKQIKALLIKHKILVYDKNSMYPGVMLEYALPYGYPKIIESEKEITLNDDECYICKVWLNVELKTGHIPMLRTKDQLACLELNIKKTDFIESTNGIFYEFNLTNYDIDIIKKHYNCDIKFQKFYVFKTRKGMFDEYINKYKELKENAKTPAEKTKSKIMLNALYGKFGSKIENNSKVLSLSDGVLKFKRGETELTKPNYVPVATFITSIARHEIVTNAQENYDNFLYADTDSLHLLDKGITPNLEIDNSKFGKWKLESKCLKGKYLRSKLYMEMLRFKLKDKKHINNFECNFLNKENYKLKNPYKIRPVLIIRGAGMTQEIKKQINFKNFYFGNTFEGKKSSKQTKGGVVIYNTTYNIKKNGLIF